MCDESCSGGLLSIALIIVSLFSILIFLIIHSCREWNKYWEEYWKEWNKKFSFQPKEGWKKVSFLFSVYCEKDREWLISNGKKGQGYWRLDDFCFSGVPYRPQGKVPYYIDEGETYTCFFYVNPEYLSWFRENYKSHVVYDSIRFVPDDSKLGSHTEGSICCKQGRGIITIKEVDG